MTLHVCQDGDKFYVQEDPEDETWLAQFNTEAEADAYVENLENKMTSEKISYIAGWIVEEVETYHGCTIEDIDFKEEMPMSEWPIKEWSELNQDVLTAMIEKAIEAWDGGARDE